jgi:hypothetical protein
MRYGLFLLFCATLWSGAASLSARAAIIEFSGTFSGLNEVPTNSSPATGTVFGVLDDVAKTLQLNATFSGLTGTVTQAHIHSSATSAPGVSAGIAVGNTTLPNFPLGVTTGTYSQTIDLNQQSVYGVAYFTNNGNNITTVSNTFIDQLKNNRSYFNIHTSTLSGGEVRANLTAVPEPSSFALIGISIGAMGWGYRRWSKHRLR